MPGIIETSCVFALKNGADLRAAEGTPVVTWHENQPWSTAEQMLAVSVQDGTLLLVVFGDAAVDGPVTHFGQLVAIDLNGDETDYTVAGIRRLHEPILLQDVIVKSTGNPIMPSDIRSYRLCETPSRLLGK